MRIVAGAILTITLMFGATAHAGIPHDHGDSHHHGGDSVVWQSLHSSLHHEDKKVLPVYVLLSILGVAALVQHRTPRTFLYSIVDSIDDALRRGIVPYRKFS